MNLLSLDHLIIFQYGASFPHSTPTFPLRWFHVSQQIWFTVRFHPRSFLKSPFHGCFLAFSPTKGTSLDLIWVIFHWTMIMGRKAVCTFVAFWHGFGFLKLSKGDERKKFPYAFVKWYDMNIWTLPTTSIPPQKDISSWIARRHHPSSPWLDTNISRGKRPKGDTVKTRHRSPLIPDRVVVWLIYISIMSFEFVQKLQVDSPFCLTKPLQLTIKMWTLGQAHHETIPWHKKDGTASFSRNFSQKKELAITTLSPKTHKVLIKQKNRYTTPLGSANTWATWIF